MNPIFSHLLAGAIGALIGGVLAIILRPAYDAAAEEVENLTADECQNLADIFQKIANRLKTPGQ